MVRNSEHNYRKSGMLVGAEFGFVHKLIGRCKGAESGEREGPRHASSGLPSDHGRPSRVKALPAWAPLTWPAFPVPKARECKAERR